MRRHDDATTCSAMRRSISSISAVRKSTWRRQTWTVDVKRVMDQVGHSDSTMTMDVYAHLQQRMDRQHGASFDRLVRKAKK